MTNKEAIKELIDYAYKKDKYISVETCALAVRALESKEKIDFSKKHRCRDCKHFKPDELQPGHRTHMGYCLLRLKGKAWSTGLKKWKCETDYSCREFNKEAEYTYDE